jgi:hypothetical protein
MKTNHPAEMYHRRRTSDVFPLPHSSTNIQNADNHRIHSYVKSEHCNRTVNTLDSYQVCLRFEFRSGHLQFWQAFWCTASVHTGIMLGPDPLQFNIKIAIRPFYAIYLWLYSPLLGVGRFSVSWSYTQSVVVGRTPWAEDQPVARPLPI